MTVTRANLEADLVERTGALLTFVGKSVVTDGTNQSLNGPIGYALRQTGYTVANVSLVADSDLVDFDVNDLDQVLDLAEYRTLENIAGNLDAVDIVNGPEQEKFSQIAQNLEKRMARLSANIETAYGAGVTVETGTITYDFADHNDTGITG